MSKHEHVTDFERLCGIVERCDTINIAIHDGDYPYVIPMSFVYRVEDGRLAIYMHSGPQGKKLDLVRACPQVGFSMCRSREPSEGLLCGTFDRFESVSGTGDITELENSAKPEILSMMMERYFGHPEKMNEQATAHVSVVRLLVRDMTGRVLERAGGSKK